MNSYRELWKTNRTESTAHQSTWGAVIGYVALISYVTLMIFLPTSEGSDLPTALVSITAFIIVHLIWPKCRFDIDTPLCPGNLAQFLFGVQIVLIPLLIMLYGFSRGNLPWLPPRIAINLALLLMTLAYVVFSAAYHYTSINMRNAIAEPGTAPQAGESYLSKKVTFMILVYATIGVFGLFLRHGSLQGYINYLTNPPFPAMQGEETATLSSAASTFFLPFTGFAVVMAWCYWIDRNRHKLSGWIAGFRTLLVFVTLALVNTFNYNRASIVVPILAVTAVYSSRVRRLSFKFLGIIGSILFIFVLVLGTYRSTPAPINELVSLEMGTMVGANLENVVSSLQVYGAASQFSGFLLQEIDWGLQLYWGNTLISSLFYPIPVLGEPFRSTSGVVIYNMLIYDDPTIMDQIVPFLGELFMNFDIPGIVLGYILLGYLAAKLQRGFEMARNTFEAYCWFLVGYWTLFLIIGSLAVVSQIYIYFFWPIYGYVALTRSKLGRRERCFIEATRA